MSIDKRHDTVAWLPRTKVRVQTGDFLVVVLSSAFFIMLGLAVMIARLSPADPAHSVQVVSPLVVAAPQKNSGASSQQTSSQQASTLQAGSKPKSGAETQIEIARNQNEIVRNVTSVGSNPPARNSPLAAAPALPADSPAPAPLARETALVVAAPIAAGVSDDLERAAEPPVRVKPEAKSTEAARTQGVKAEPPPPESALRKGGEGATWSVYLDSFPDQRAAAAQINALQSKYGPYLGGRRLTYTRKGESWLMRSSGLTQEAADQVCEKVRKAGLACSVGGR